MQRNKGIDAFLKKHYLGAPVAIRLQKPSESLQDAAVSLYMAGMKKRCSFTVLVNRFSPKIGHLANVPDNMIIVTSNALECERQLEYLSQQCRNKSDTMGTDSFYTEGNIRYLEKIVQDMAEGRANFAEQGLIKVEE